MIRRGAQRSPSERHAVENAVKPRNSFDSAGRFLRIIKWLEDGEEVTYARITEELDVGYAQAREVMTFLGGFYPVRQGRDRKIAVFYKGTEMTSEKALVRALTLEFGRSAAHLLSGTAYEQEALVLRKSFMTAIGPKEAEHFHAFMKLLYFRRIEEPSFPEREAEIGVLLRAIKHRKPITMTYQRLFDGKREEYCVDPLALVLFRENMQLLARAHDPPQKKRTFDLDGIIDCRCMMQDSFRRQRSFDVVAEFKHAFGRYIDYLPKDVRLRVRGVPANYLRRRKVHATQVLEEQGEEVRLSMRVGLCPDLEGWILSLIPDVIVEAPQELTSRIIDRMSLGLERMRANRQ